MNFPAIAQEIVQCWLLMCTFEMWLMCELCAVLHSSGDPKISRTLDDCDIMEAGFCQQRR